MLDIIFQNPEGAIAFLNNECMANEFSWLNEILPFIESAEQCLK